MPRSTQLVAHYGWEDVIYNYASMRVPGEPRNFLMKRYGLRMVSQPAIRFYQRISYHAYEGIAEGFGERERINCDLGNNCAMIMHNHGLLTVGKSAREAFVLMRYLMEAAKIELMLEAIRPELIGIPSEICAKTAAQYEAHDAGRAIADCAAYLRMLDKEDRSYQNC